MSTSASPNEPTAYPPHKTALLLLDYHGFLVSRIQPQEEKDEFISKIKNIVETARQNAVPVIHCLIGTDQDPPQTSKMTTTWKTGLKPVINSQPEMLIEPSEFLNNDDVTVTRRAGVISAMKSDGILEFLRGKGVESLVMSGIATSGAVVSTARDASDLGFIATVVGNGCWDPSADAHKVILENVLPMAAWVVDDKKGIEILSDKANEM